MGAYIKGAYIRGVGEYSGGKMYFNFGGGYVWEALNRGCTIRFRNNQILYLKIGIHEGIKI